MRTGAIKPCKIGEDGKPQPIEHILELQEGLKNQQIVNRNKDESDWSPIIWNECVKFTWKEMNWVLTYK